jgi:hypothetical protein
MQRTSVPIAMSETKTLAVSLFPRLNELSPIVRVIIEYDVLPGGSVVLRDRRSNGGSPAGTRLVG